MKHYVERDHAVDWSGIIKPLTSQENAAGASNGEYYIPTDLEAVAMTTTPDEAIECYRYRYPDAAITAGMVSPQDATAMIVEIAERYGDAMSPEERTFIENEAAQRVQEIAAASEDDTPTIPSLYRIVDIIDMLDEDAPAEVVADAEYHLILAIEAVKDNSVVGEAMVEKLEEAIELYNSPENNDPLGMIVTNLEVKRISEAQDAIEQKSEADFYSVEQDATALHQTDRAA